MTLVATILAAAKAVGVPGALLLAICTHETNLKNITVPNDGGSPSYGVCQIKEKTARALGFKGAVTGPTIEGKVFFGTLEPKGKPAGLLVPSVNAKYAAKYLKKQLDKYEGDWCKATAAYNAGRYNPSSKVMGCPRNLKYIKKVVLHLDGKNKDQLACGPGKTENEQ